MSAAHSTLYRDIWRADPSYGTAHEWVEETVTHRIAPFMQRHNLTPVTVADFGAGDGRYLVEMIRQGLCRNGIGIDYHIPHPLPAHVRWHQQDMSAYLVLRTGFVISADALEHVPQHDVPHALRNMRTCATHGWARVSLIPDLYGTSRGMELHETLLTAHQWLALFRKHDLKPLEYRVYLDGPEQVERAIEIGW